MSSEDHTEPYTKIIAEAVDLHLRKAKDYGTNEDPYANIRAATAAGVQPWVGVLIRMNDKMIRLMSIAKKGYAANESARDSGLDLINYAAFMVMLLDEQSNPRPGQLITYDPHSPHRDTV